MLCIEPGSLRQPLIALILKADLIYFEGVVITSGRENIAYEALSYSWGYPEFTHAITSNGEAFPATRNLHQSLQYLRYGDRARYVWIDAICINQLDLDEKSAQTRNMFTIFKKATQVIAWLGEKEECGEVAIDYISLSASLDKQSGNVDEQNGNSGDKSKNIDQLEETYTCPKCHKDIKKGLKAFLGRPCFRRTWVRLL